MGKYRVGKTFFEELEDQQIWILNGILMNLEYIGKEGNLSSGEDALRKLSIRNIKKVIKSIEKSKLK
jgi:hypothetical protein